VASIALDPTYGDWALVNGRLVIITGAVECAQKIAARLKFFKRAWFRDVRQGIPYWEAVFIKAPDINAISSFFRGVVLGVPGVKSVESMSVQFQRAQRVLNVIFTAQHDSGAIIEGGPGKPFLVDGKPVDVNTLLEAA
jgi:hypothetical protein